jgi:hypothetical protein
MTADAGRPGLGVRAAPVAAVANLHDDGPAVGLALAHRRHERGERRFPRRSPNRLTTRRKPTGLARSRCTTAGGWQQLVAGWQTSVLSPF